MKTGLKSRVYLVMSLEMFLITKESLDLANVKQNKRYLDKIAGIGGCDINPIRRLTKPEVIYPNHFRYFFPINARFLILANCL